MRRTLQRILGRGWVENPPKSARGRRAVTLPPLAVEALRAHRRRQAAERLQAGARWEDRDLVFASGRGRPLEAHAVLERFGRLLQRPGLPHVRLHDLRHTAASLLLAEGVHPKVVQELLGHSAIGVTLDTYSHVLPELHADAAARLGRLLNANC